MTCTKIHKLKILDNRLNQLIKTKIGNAVYSDIRIHHLHCKCIARLLEHSFRYFKISINTPESEGDVCKVEFIVEINDTTKYIKTLTFELYGNPNIWDCIGWRLVQE